MPWVMKSSGGRWWWQLNNLNVLNDTELYPWKWLKQQILCTFYHNKNYSTPMIKMANFVVCTYYKFYKAMAPHSSILAWEIPWTEEPGRLQPMGVLRVGHNWAASLSLFTFIHWRRKWQPTPMFLPGESQGWGSLVDCHLWGRTESDTTEAT